MIQNSFSASHVSSAKVVYHGNWHGLGGIDFRLDGQKL